MKKIVAILLLALMVVGVQAQIVTSRSSFQTVERVEKVPLKLEWYAKLGLNLMQANPHCPYGHFYGEIINGENNATGNKTRVGFNLGIGMLSHFRPSKPSNFYWGAELGITQIGGEWDANKLTVETYSFTETMEYPEVGFTKFAGYFGPVIGWKKPLFGDIQLDIHISPQILMSFESDIEKDYSPTYIFSDGVVKNYEEVWYIDLPFPGMAIQGGIGVWFNKFIIDLSYRRLIPICGGEAACPSNIMLSVGYNF